MDQIVESHFGWTTRRVVLPRRAADREMSSSSGVVTDCRPLPERPDVRLLVYHDDADDSDYDAVAIGKTDGANDIPVLTTVEECLLVTAVRPGTVPRSCSPRRRVRTRADGSGRSPGSFSEADRYCA